MDDEEEQQQKRDQEGGEEEQVPEGYTTMQLDNGDVMAIPLPADQPLPPVPQYPVADALADRLTSAFAQGPIELAPFVDPDQQQERIDRKPFIIKKPK